MHKMLTFCSVTKAEEYAFLHQFVAFNNFLHVYLSKLCRHSSAGMNCPARLHLLHAAKVIACSLNEMHIEINLVTLANRLRSIYALLSIPHWLILLRN